MAELATNKSTEFAKNPFGRHSGDIGVLSVPIVAEENFSRLRERRRAQFRAAVDFAFKVDLPLNFGLTLTWTGLKSAGERNEGHCLGLLEWDREKYLRKELARCCRLEGLQFAALWGRDVGARMGSHVHISIYFPHYKLIKLVALIERITGSSSDFLHEPFSDDVVSRSVCGSWQINMNRRDKAGAWDWADYIATQDYKHPSLATIPGKAYGVSQAIGKTAQERHQLLSGAEFH